MTRLLLAGLVVVGVALGVGVNGQTPEAEYQQKRAAVLRQKAEQMEEVLAEIRAELAQTIAAHADLDVAATQRGAEKEAALSDEDVRRAIEQQRSAQTGRFQIAPLENSAYKFLVLDTTTGEVWGGTGGKPKPYKLMTSVLDAQE